MKKLATITSVALLAVGLSGAAFAQANPSAPQPNSVGNGVVQPGTTGTGTATDARMKRQTGTTGMSGNNSELKGDSATSAGGANSLSNTNNPGGMGNNAGPPMK
jgi:hypothetical protein